MYVCYLPKLVEFWSVFRFQESKAGILRLEKVKMVNRNQSPCLTCVKVKEPEKCEYKLCKEWSAWFLRRWEEIHSFYKRYRSK